MGYLQAEGLVLTLRDLFQVVFEMKKREVEEAKKHKDENKENKEIKEEPSESRPVSYLVGGWRECGIYIFIIKQNNACNCPGNDRRV